MRLFAAADGTLTQRLGGAGLLSYTELEELVPDQVAAHGPPSAAALSATLAGSRE